MLRWCPDRVALTPARETVILHGLSATLVPRQGSTDSCETVLFVKNEQCDQRFRQILLPPLEATAVVGRPDIGTFALLLLPE